MTDGQPGSVLRPATPDEPDSEQLVRDHIGWMLVLARRMVVDAALAEDVVQDAFIAAFGALDKFEGRSSIRTWLHRITVNAALMRLRKLKRLGEQSLDDCLPEFDRHDCRLEARCPPLASAEDILESDRTRALVTREIESLPDNYRIVLQLRDIEGLDTKEVAKLLEISENSVKVRLHRARAALKKLLEPILRGGPSK